MKLINIIFLLLIISISFSGSIDIEVTGSACDNEGDLLQTVTNLPACIAESIFSTLVSGLIYSAKQFFEFSMGFLTATPNLNWFCSPYNSIMAILESLYTILLMGLGLYYVINSSNPEGRAMSKIWLKNVFLMMIVLAFSFNIFEMIIDLNQYISTTLYSNAGEEIFNINAGLSNLIFALVIAFSLLTSGLVTFFTLIIRYIMIPFLLLMFPISVFLYFMPITRGWGAFIFKFSMLIIFMTSIDSILLLGMSALFNTPDPNLAGDLVKAISIMIGFGLIGLVNVLIFVVATISVAAQAIKSVESLTSSLMKLAILKALI